MPTPEPNESKEHYLDRCMAYPDLQDRKPDQRYAICNSLWDKHHQKSAQEKLPCMDTPLIFLGDAVKALDDKGKIGGYLIRFGSREQRDCDGDYFTTKTYLGPTEGDGAECLFHHSKAVTKGLERLADRTFQPIKTRRDEIGIWAETVLNIADEYERKVYEMVKAGKLGWSSGSAPHRVRKSADGQITQWPIVEGSLTPMPAEPRNYGGILPIKSLESLSVEQGECKDMGTADSATGGTLVPDAATATAQPEKKEEQVAEQETEQKTVKGTIQQPAGHALLAQLVTSLSELESATCKGIAKIEPGAHVLKTLKTISEAIGEAKTFAAEKITEHYPTDDCTEGAEQKTDDDDALEDEYKQMTPTQKAVVDRELAELNRIQQELDSRKVARANHERRLQEAHAMRSR